MTASVHTLCGVDGVLELVVEVCNRARESSGVTHNEIMRGGLELSSVVGRRLLLGTAALFSLPPPATVFGATGLSRDDVDRRLSRVPVFVVTNKDASPYLTEMSAAGKRSGFFFLSPQEAVQALNDIRGFDPRASLNVLPLDQVWYDVSKTIAEADKAPQPTAGTSTDMRLFRLKPFDDEIRAAQKLPSATSVLKDEGAIPLFYEPSLQIDVDGRAQQPYFFRFSDLAAAFEAQQDTGATGLNDPPQPAVASLANVIRGLETGQTSADTLLVAASEAAGVVQRMTGGNGVGMPGGNEATAGNGISKPAPRQDDGGAPFYLSVPFAGGRRV